jgi:hypothetical protein
MAPIAGATSAQPRVDSLDPLRLTPRPQRRPRLGLAGQRPVEVDLEDLRELGVDRGDRPRHRRGQDAPRLGRLDRQRRGQLGAVVDRLPGGELAGDPGALEHLLGAGEEVDHPPGGLGVLAVGVDGELRAAQRGGGVAAGAGRHRRHREPPGHRRGPGVGEQREGVGPVAHQHRLAVLEGEAHLLLLPGQRRLGDHPVAPHAVAHVGQRLDRRLRVHRHPARGVEDGATEAAEVLEEHGHQPLVARPLPDEAVGEAGAAAGGRGLAAELGEARRRPLQQVGAPVEHPHVDEPGQRVEGAAPAVGLDGGGEEGVDVGGEAVERQDPAGGAELGGPHHVELEDVGVAGAGVEPLDVELVALVGGVGGAALLDHDVGVGGGEARELRRQHLGLRTQRAAGEGDYRRAAGGGAAAAGGDAGERGKRQGERQGQRGGQRRERTAGRSRLAEARGGDRRGWLGSAHPSDPGNADHCSDSR